MKKFLPLAAVAAIRVLLLTACTDSGAGPIPGTEDRRRGYG